MLDLACSLVLSALLATLAALYGIRTLRKGRAQFTRVDRDGGSALLGRGAMEMGYWGLEPLGRACIHAGLTPNTITYLSLAVGLGAAGALAFGHFGVAALLAALAALGDALDGFVARATGVASDAGEVLDAAVDRYEEFAFLGGLAICYASSVPLLVLVLSALLGSFMVSYATAKAEALRVAIPRGTMRRTERAVYLTLGAAMTPLSMAACDAASLPALYGQAPMLLALGLVGFFANASAVQRLHVLARRMRERDRQATQRPSSPPPPAKPSGARERTLFHMVGRHQLASAGATLVDFGTMVLAVEAFAARAVPATVLGASVGAVANFIMGRRWTFRAMEETWPSQAFRYGFVSASSLGLNVLGEYLISVKLGTQYLAARALVATAVSLLWNFPMQRSFVFARDASSRRVQGVEGDELAPSLTQESTQ